MENKTKKSRRHSLFFKTKHKIRKIFKKIKKLWNRVTTNIDDSMIEMLHPETVKNKALKNEYKKLMSLHMQNVFTSQDALFIGSETNITASDTLSPLESEILKRIDLLTAKDKANEAKKAYRKQIVKNKLEKMTTVNPDKTAVQPTICAIKCNPLPVAYYSEIISSEEKPVFPVLSSHKENTATYTIQSEQHKYAQKIIQKQNQHIRD